MIAAAVVTGCGKKTSSQGPSAEVTGLAAIPASAEVVIGIDVARVLDSPLVDRAIDLLLQRDPSLAERWDKLHASCKLEPKQFSHVALAIGPHEGPQPGTGPVLVVATGKLVETDLATCVRAMVGQGSGGLTASPLGNRTLYEARDGNRVMYFAFGRPDTVVMSANRNYVTEALGTGKKVTDNPDMQKWLSTVDQKAPIWAAGRVDDRVRQGMVKVMNGAITAGPVAITGSLDLGTGVKAEIGVLMPNPADAKAVETYAKTQLGLAAMAAQAKSLAKVVDAFEITSDGTRVRFIAALDQGQVNQLISALDGGGGSAQSAPPNGSADGSAGSATGSATTP
ncbi:MAG: hypothetical protein QM831_34490 [Kofleriaceae bacterium]